MKICSIHIKGFQQFEDLYLDFTNPATGEPVDKVCFIGRNGTGKSTLLGLINKFLKVLDIDTNYDFLKVEILDGSDRFYLIVFTLMRGTTRLTPNRTYYLSKEIDKEINWQSILFDENRDINERKVFWDQLATKYEFEYNHVIKSLKDNSNDLLIYAPIEKPISNKKHLIGVDQSSRGINNVPESNLNNALKLFKSFPFYHEVLDENVGVFWTLLIYLIKKRESEKETFENQSENIDKTKRQLNEEFDSANSKILDKIAILWNKILDRAGLEFDVEGAKVPVQLTDNLHAYIRHKKTKEIIHYSQLSTGIRNFIFRIGHIYSLYFNREIKRGFLLVDEPENSLFPDFLFELMELYDEIIEDKNGEKNTQMFFATHSPIVAAQFQPYERIVLEWDDEGKVTSHKGISPIGDDPNDVLVNDFQLDHLMGREGQEMWNKYLGLQKALRNETDPSQKQNLLLQLNKIGKDYNFE